MKEFPIPFNWNFITKRLKGGENMRSREKYPGEMESKNKQYLFRLAALFVSGVLEVIRQEFYVIIIKIFNIY